jgi:hypothetical protein
VMDTTHGCEVGFSGDIMRSTAHMKSIARFRFLVEVAPELPMVTGIWWSEDVDGTQLMTVSVMSNYVFEVVLPRFNYDRDIENPTDDFWVGYRDCVREYNNDGDNNAAA